ncbi:DNA-binding HxlR family transcriptional regulator [Bosea sp. BE125]|nr:DNA-binding HxlR family transcriptional regulator [Bosea sp. BE125]
MKNKTIEAQDPIGNAESDTDSKACAGAPPVRQFQAAMHILTGKWKGEILWQLTQGTLRFGELRRAIPGITQHMLTTQLRDLERHGLVKRTLYAEVPPRVEYELTRAAFDLRPVFEAIQRWSEAHAIMLHSAADEAEPHDGPARPRRRNP